MSSCPVSVIVPAFNAEQSVAQAVQSALDQGVDGIEILVIDDGSTDRTASLLQQFAPVSAVRILRHPGGVNRGVCAARRLAIGEATGEFIAFLDADDSYLPGKLAHHIALLRAHPAVVLVHGRTISTGKAPEGAGGPGDGFSMGEEPQQYDWSHASGFLKHNPICNSTVVCRRSSIGISDLPEEMTFQFEDWVLFTSLALRGPFLYDPRPLSRYSCHEGSFTHRHFRRSGSWEVAYLEYLLIMISRLPTAAMRRRVGGMITEELVRLAQIRGDRAACALSGSQIGHEPRIASLLLGALTPAALVQFVKWKLRFSRPGRWLRKWRTTSRAKNAPPS